MKVIAKKDRVLMVVVFAVSLLPLLFSDRQSFWIDEGVTFAVAAMSGIMEITAEVWRRNTSEPQMLGYFVLIHLWNKLFGDSELASRLSNVPWLAVFVFFWVRIGRLLTRDRTVLALFALSAAILPFVVYYSVEYRPYTALVACGGFQLYAYLMADDGRPRYRRIFALASCLALFLHMIGIFSLLSFAALDLYRSNFNFRQVFGKWRDTLVWFVPVVGLFCVYYGATVLRGSGGIIIRPTLANLAQIFYEFLGFAGLGPNREGLRDIGVRRLLLNYGPAFALVLFGYLRIALDFSGHVPLSGSSREWNGVNVKTLWLSALVSLIGLPVLFICAFIVRWNIVGRHCALFFVPFAAPIAACVCASLARPRDWLSRASAALILISWIYSSQRLVFDQTYYRDDYRAVASYLKRPDMTDKFILLSGDVDTHRYYLEGGSPKRPMDGVSVVNNLDRSAIDAIVSKVALKDVVIITHKPRYYDQNLGLASWLSAHPEFSVRQTYMNFEIFSAGQTPL